MRAISRACSSPGTPVAAFLLTDTILVFDNVRQTILVVRVTGVEAGETAPAAYARAMDAIDGVYQRLLTADSIARYMERRGARTAHHVGAFTSEMTKAEFTEMVLACKDAIRAGEVIQIVPSQKFTAETDIPALALYRALRMVNPSPYNFFLKIGSKTLIGSSPEELVKFKRGIASTCPIAGTRPRGRTTEEDRRLEDELVHDPKERAEHVMLVDLGRNDLGRVCRIGSVRVEDYAHVERYSHVMHLVSNVFGELDTAKGMDAFDLLEATFPAGTLSGAPKVRAMELIAQIEKSPRGIYGGAAGYFSYTGDMNFAIVIRTMLLERGRLTMRAGAGIVADSDPEREYQETINKSKAIFAAAQFAAFNTAASNALSGIYAVLDSTVPADSTTSLQTELLGNSPLDSTFTTEGSADAIRALHCGDAVAVQYSSLSLIMAVRLDPLDGSSLDAVRSQVLSDLKSDELADALADYGASMEHHLDAPAMNNLPVSKIEPASSSNR